MSAVFAALAILHSCNEAAARDLGQWENSTPEQRAWYQSLLQPDTLMSCCGEGDAYWTDEVHVEGDRVVAVITDERDDGPLRRQHVEPGSRYVVPSNKVVDSTKQHGNPTGHAIIFLGGTTWNMGTEKSHRDVLCYVPGAGF